jgi:Mg-chelatase subunit ChlD
MLLAEAPAMARLWVAALVLTACDSVGWVGESNVGLVVDDPDQPAAEEVSEPIECATFSFSAQTVAANLLLLVDTSGSMNDPATTGGPGSKLADTRAALGVLLDAGESKIRFGLMHYPGSADACDPGSVEVDCGDSSVPAIRTRVAALAANGGTPTGGALDVADAYAALHDPIRKSFVALLTDGLPTCPAGAGSTTTSADQQAAVQAVTALHADGIDTFVIGLGQDLNAADPALLDSMAAAGGRPRQGASRYYQANDLGELTAALADIGDVVMGCSHVLDPLPGGAQGLVVTLDGTPIDRDPSHTEAWDFDPAQARLTFYGETCALLQQGDVARIDVVVTCLPLS